MRDNILGFSENGEMQSFCVFAGAEIYKREKNHPDATALGD